MTRLLLLTVACVAWIAVAPRAQAQVPFFNQGAALFDPEISTLTTGVLSDVQATVSADRKYVTMNMRMSNSELVALREFTFQSSNMTGFAGMPGGGGGAGAGQIQGNNLRGNAAGGAAVGGVPQRQPAADAAPAVQRASILNREGMTLVGRADVVARSRAGAP
jgi:hypothetical protein